MRSATAAPAAPLKDFTNFQTGGVFRVKSDIPVTAYLHSALNNTASNDSSMLLPLPTLRQDYVIASYPGFADPVEPDKLNGRPSYFNVIATEKDTTVEWTPRVDTAGDQIAVFKVKAGETGSIEAGKRADFVLLDAPGYLHLVYHFGVNLVSAVYRDGVRVV